MSSASPRACVATGALKIQLHWVLDVAFQEDASRIRKDHAPANLAVVRHIALNLLRQDSSAKGDVKAKRLQAGWDNAYLTRLLST